MLTTALTALLKIPDLLIQALRALVPLLEVAPQLLVVWSAKRIEALSHEIITLESAAKPEHRARLGELRVQIAAARKLHETLQSGIAAAASKSADKDG